MPKQRKRKSLSQLTIMHRNFGKQSATNDHLQSDTKISNSIMYMKTKQHILKRRLNSVKQSKNIQQLYSPKSHRIIVRSKQQKELMDYLGAPLLPILVQPYNRKSKKPRMEKTISALDSILGNQEKFMKTYFKEIKQFKKNQHHQQQISYIFPQVSLNGWQIRGYIKGKHLLIKAIKNKKCIFKKYLYSEVREEIRKNYESWICSKFLLFLDEIK